MNARLLHAPRAWLGADRGGWAEGVLIEVDRQGDVARLDTGVVAPPADAVRLPGPVLPSLVDAHSHAFQRAFAGLAERLEPGHAHDDFWSWRSRMYDVALRIEADALRDVAAFLYAELLEGGYTQVCEFHYLHQRPDGRAYDDPLALAWAHADAAAGSGIGLTMVPVVYERGGFDDAPLLPAQQRFALDADAAWAARGRIAAAGRPRVDAAVGVHSLRAARPASIDRLLQLAGDDAGPIHVHAAEQVREVEQCLAATGQRPIEWLAARPGVMDARMFLVHATHTTREEVDAVAARGAGVVLCPSTEGNLGDGLADLPGWLDARDGAAGIALGTDSHVGREWREELRWLEYGQRLGQRRRVVGAQPPGPGRTASVAARLLDRVVQGGGAACGRRGRWGLRPGARADFVVADADAAATLGLPAERLLDALVFSSPQRPWREVWVQGERVVAEGRHRDHAALAARFAAAMRRLWPAG